LQARIIGIRVKEGKDVQPGVREQVDEGDVK
jgi:hypothetical protein